MQTGGAAVAKAVTSTFHEWAGTFLAASLIGAPAVLHTFPALIPDAMLKMWLPDTRLATQDETKHAQKLLERFGVFDAEARVRVFAYKYHPGEPNDVALFGSMENLRILAPEPFLQPQNVPLKDTYSVKSKFFPADLTPQKADSLPAADFENTRRELIANEKIMVLSEREQETMWRGTAAAIKLDAERNIYTTGLAWLMLGVAIAMPIRRINPKFLPVIPRMSNITIGMGLTGMLAGAHAAQRKIIEDVCRDDLNVCDAALRQTAAEQAYNLARKTSALQFWITSSGNDWLASIGSLTRRVNLIMDRITEIKKEQEESKKIDKLEAKLENK